METFPDENSTIKTSTGSVDLSLVQVQLRWC